MAHTILSLDRLRKDFGGLRATDVSLDIVEGELRCLIGPNGAGKSTLLKLLCGHLKPSGGSVRFRGQDITGYDEFRIARLGIAVKFQAPSLFEQLTALQNLHLAAERRFGYAEGRARSVSALNAAGLSARAADPAASLSHGQQQRLEVAMATIAGPALLLLDEPTAGLSPEDVSRTAVLVKKLSPHTTIVVVEHNMDFVRRLDARVTVLHQGEVFAEGTMAEMEVHPGVRDIYLGRQVHPGAGGR